MQTNIAVQYAILHEYLYFNYFEVFLVIYLYTIYLKL